MKIRGKKNTSKRKSLSLQHKITKKATEKKRKQRSEARKLQKNGVTLKTKRRKLNKLNQIPSKWPFKREELLLQKQKAEQREKDHKKHLEQQRLERNREKKKKEVEKRREKNEAEKTKLMSGIKRGGLNGRGPEYELIDTLEVADMVVEVVDARDVMGTRVSNLSGANNEKVTAMLKDKKRVVIVTKGDQVPKENLEQWLNQLREVEGDEVPVLPLIKKTHAEDVDAMSSKKKLNNKKNKEDNNHATAPVLPSFNIVRRKPQRPIGFESLAKALTQISGGSINIKNVAIIGYAKVGKHTVEGYLKSPALGFQHKKMKIHCCSLFKEMEIEEKAGLKDAETVKESDNSNNTVVVTNTASQFQDLLLSLPYPQSVKQPLFVLKRLLERCPSKKQLQIALSLPGFDDTKALLEHIQKTQALSGLNDAARCLLKTWRVNCRYYTEFEKPKDGEKNEEDSDKEKSTVTKKFSDIYDQIKKEIESFESSGPWGATATATHGFVIGQSVLGNTVNKIQRPDPKSSVGTGMEVDEAASNINTSTTALNYFALKPISTTKISSGPLPDSLLNYGAIEFKVNEDDDDDESMEDDDDEEGEDLSSGWEEDDGEEEDSDEDDEEMEE